MNDTKTLSGAEILATISRHRDAHQAMAYSDAYSAQEYPRLRDAHAAVAALVAENEELRKSATSLLYAHEELGKHVVVRNPSGSAAVKRSIRAVSWMRAALGLNAETQESARASTTTGGSHDR